MSRESCVLHPPKQLLAIIRQDYYELTGRDSCAAALLNIFEYWANAALASDPDALRPWVGERPIREFEQRLLGIATDKQIRKRLRLLEEMGFIQTSAPARRGAAKAYRVLLPELQQALSNLAPVPVTAAEKPLRSNNPTPFGQMTDEAATVRSFDPTAFGQMTDEASVKQPTTFGHMTDAPAVKQPILLRSNDRALKKISLEFKPEENQEEEKKECFSGLNAKLASPAEQSTSPVTGVPIQIGAVAYAQPPESIDLAELWEKNPGSAKQQIRLLAPGHKRPEMVAHGVGHWWLGNGLNDFDEDLIQACQNRKRKFQQSDSIGDAKTYINNMIRNGDWANFALRCDEAVRLRERAVVQIGRAHV
jgi:hypothetical protein